MSCLLVFLDYLLIYLFIPDLLVFSLFRARLVSQLEQFSIECRKTKTKVITLASHKGHRQSSEPIKTRSKVHVAMLHKARENVPEQVAIGFGFTSDWSRKWREFFKPITERSNAKPKRTRITFYTQVKTTLASKVIWFCIA